MYEHEADLDYHRTKNILLQSKIHLFMLCFMLVLLPFHLWNLDWLMISICAFGIGAWGNNVRWAYNTNINNYYNDRLKGHTHRLDYHTLKQKTDAEFAQTLILKIYKREQQIKLLQKSNDEKALKYISILKTEIEALICLAKDKMTNKDNTERLAQDLMIELEAKELTKKLMS